MSNPFVYSQTRSRIQQCRLTQLTFITLQFKSKYCFKMNVEIVTSVC